MIAKGVLVAIVILPVGGLTTWYGRRLREVKEGRRHDNRTAGAIIQQSQLEARVTREGIAVFVAVLIYWGILSVIF